MSAPDLTIAIIHHHLRGYPQECIESLAPLPAGTELLLVQTDSAAPVCAQARVIPVPRDSSRAAAKNLAVAGARGEYLLLAASEAVACPGTVERLRELVGEAGAPVVASAQLLQENGMPRRTGFALPSIARELNFFGWLWRQRRFAVRSRKPPVAGPVRRAEALHATFLMARRETFRAVGEFGRIPIRFRGPGMVLARGKKRRHALLLPGRAGLQARAATEGGAFAGTQPRPGSLAVALRSRHARGRVCAGLPRGARIQIARLLARRGRPRLALARRLGTPGEPGGCPSRGLGNAGGREAGRGTPGGCRVVREMGNLHVTAFAPG